MNIRRPISLFAAIIATNLASSAVFAQSTVPCEDMLKDVRAKMSAAKLNDSDKAKVQDLEAKGVERCNADDDKRADDFFTQALKIIGK
jgi:hypothetical protein